MSKTLGSLLNAYARKGSAVFEESHYQEIQLLLERVELVADCWESGDLAGSIRKLVAHAQAIRAEEG